MKKHFYSIIFLLTFLGGYSQNQIINLTFKGEDSLTHNSLPLENVYIKNYTLGCDTTISGNSPSIRLNVPLGIGEQMSPGTEIFTVMPVFPDPFEGKTMVRIRLNRGEAMKITLLDLQGRVISSYNGFINGGLQRFEIESSVSGLMFLNVSTNGKEQSVRLLNTGKGGGENRITCLGSETESFKSGSTQNFTYRLGNLLIFTSEKTGYNDKSIYDSPLKDSTYNFILSGGGIILPLVTTLVITDIAQTTAIGWGNVTSEGSSGVLFRGICWSKSKNPTIADDHCTNGYGQGTFSCLLTGLTDNTKYYVRAYASNSEGTGYGDTISFRTRPIQPPSISTAPVTGITPTSAICGGNIVSDSGATIISRGVCWGLHINPTISDNHTSDGTGTGTFVSSMTGLTPKTPYFIRAYVISNAGTVYGENQLFNSGGFSLLTVPGSYQGWNPGDSTNIVTSVNSDSTYEGFIWFPANTQYKYAAGSWTENWGDDSGNGQLDPNGSNIVITDEGYYQLHANLLLMYHTFFKTTWSIVGSATSGGWTTDTEMTYNISSKTWTVTLDLSAGGIKFRANDNWTINYGDDGQYAGTLLLNGNNILIAEPGNYTITMYLGLSLYRYTVIKN